MKKIWIICILFLLLLTGCGKRNVESVKEKEVEVVVRNVNDEEKEFFIQRIEELKYLDYYSKSFKVNELSNQEVLQFIYYLYKDNISNNIHFKDLEQYLNNYMEFPLEPENILCNTHFNRLGGSDYLYLYSIYDDSYGDNPNHLMHPKNGFGSDIYNQYISGKVENDIYTIRVYKVFSSLLNEVRDYNVSFYRTYKDASNKENAVFQTTYTGKYARDISKEMTKYDDLYVYQYVFKKVDNQYLLVSYEIDAK